MPDPYYKAADTAQTNWPISLPKYDSACAFRASMPFNEAINSDSKKRRAALSLPVMAHVS